jgi:hypothetical protein
MSTPESSSFNIAATAALYSQLAGVLAGFAFAALILLLTVRLSPSPAGTTPPSTSPFARPTRVLVVAFIGLVLTSVNYAVLAGDISNTPRSATLELLAGLGFATSGSLLLYAIVLTFDGVNQASGSAHPDLVSVGNYMRKSLAIVMVPLLSLLIYLGVQDFKNAIKMFTINWIDVSAWVLIGVEFVIGWAYYVWRTRATSPAMSDAAKDNSIRKVSSAGLGLTLVATLGFSIASAILNSAADDVPLLVPIAILLLTLVSAFMFVWHLAVTQP